MLRNLFHKNKFNSICKCVLSTSVAYHKFSKPKVIKFGRHMVQILTRNGFPKIQLLIALK